MINVKLKGDVIKQYPDNIPAGDIAKDLGMGLYKACCCCSIDGKISDLRTNIQNDCELTFLTFDDFEGKKAFWHTTAHILAQAVKRLYPNTKLAIGPSIDNGFYYDVDVEKSFTPQDIEKIEKEMKNIVKEKLNLERFELYEAEAIELMKDEPYKVELIKEHSALGEKISFYKQGDFVDLCAGPHLMDLSVIKAIKLTQCTGAYWRGDNKNQQLCRVYGISFPKASLLENYLEQVEEAKKRDHNVIGRKLSYFTTSENIGQGLPLLMPKGAKLMQTLQRFIEDESEKRGYLLTKTPIFAKSDLYKISGHWQHYKDGMFVLGDEEKDSEVFGLRPMTCPFQFMIYNNDLYSYKQLPIRYSENSTLCRNESSGEMHGLIRVRQFTLSDAHIIATPEQVNQEFKMVVSFTKDMMKILDISDNISYRFSKWDKNDTEKYIDDPEAWENTQNMMREILNELNIDYVEADGEAAFYGPKLDIQMKNVHGKEDTLITIQIDFALAKRFNMVYVDADNTKKHPFIIHHSIIGSYERTIAMLIEKYDGDLPLWLAPIQARILPLGEKHLDKSYEVLSKLRENGILAEVDNRSEKIGYKIREAQLEKIPYMLILGDNEVENNTVSIRSRKHGEMDAMTIDNLINHLKDEIKDKK